MTSYHNLLSVPGFRQNLLGGLLLWGLILASQAPGQETAAPPPGQKKSAGAKESGTKTPPITSKDREDYEAFWYGTDQHTRHAAAALAAGVPDPWTRLALTWAGQELAVWGGLPDAAPDTTPDLRSQFLKDVPNGKAFLELPQGKLSKLPASEQKEMKAFSLALIATGRTPAAAFRKSAAANVSVDWARMSTEPEKNQGKVVSLKGWLTRLVRKSAPAAAVAEFVPYYYEGWFHTGFGGKNGVFVTFIELPKDVKAADDLDLYIQFDGYFFKQFRYLTPKGPETGLLVMARTFDVVAKAPPANVDRAPPLPEKLLQFVKDDREFPKIANKDPDKVTVQEKFEIEAYTAALLNVAKTPAKAFATSARDNSAVTYSHLFQEPWKYRGKVVPFKGKLKRLRQIDTTVEATRQGVAQCYEGWVFPETKYSTPLCVLFAHLPEGVSIGENIDYPIHFDGYFFKRYLYLASDQKPMRTLFLLAPTFTVNQVETGTEAGLSMTGLILFGIVGMVAVTLVMIAGLHWWFRRSDAPVQARLATARASLLLPGDGLADGEPDQPETPLAAGDTEPPPDYPFAPDPLLPADPDPNSPRFRL